VPPRLRGSPPSAASWRANSAAPFPAVGGTSGIRVRSAGNEFTGEVNWAQTDLDEAAEDLDDLITPEGRLHIAMARQ
jgi:hypothetical protein